MEVEFKSQVDKFLAQHKNLTYMMRLWRLQIK